MGATPQPDDTVARLADLQRQIDELGRKTLTQFAVTQYSQPLIKIYPDPVLTNPDGTPYIQMTFGSTTGIIWKLLPKVFSGNIVLKASWGWFNDQTQAEELVSADALTGKGLDKPYIPVSMYRTFVPFSPGFPGAAANQSGNSLYFGVDVIVPNNLYNGTNTGAVYSGYVALRSHPKIRFVGVWGPWAGPGTMTIQYNVNGGGVVLSKTYSTYGTDIVDLDISSLPYNQSLNVDINITGFASTTSATIMGVQLKACFLKGS